jgi:hypothetical protein
LTTLQKDEMAKSYIDDNVSASRLAKQYNVNHHTILKYLRQKNISIRHMFKFNAESTKRCVDMYNNGCSSHEISRELHVDKKAILRQLGLAGVAIRHGLDSRKDIFNKLDKDKLIYYYLSQKKSILFISKIYKCSFTAVRNSLKHYNIPLRTNMESNKIVGKETGYGIRKHRSNHKGGTLNPAGYKMIYQPSHPRANQGGYVFEHRLVIEKKIGRYLLRSEHIHHINGVHDDNRIINLELLTHSQHMTRTLLCTKCPLIKENHSLRKELNTLRQQLQSKLELQ